MSTFPPVGASAHVPRRLRSLLIAAIALLAAFLGAAAPASASHLQGGYFTAKITSDGRLQGTITYLEVYACSSGLGTQKSLPITITPPVGTAVSKSVNTVATRCLSGGSTYEGSFDYPLDTTTFPGGAPDGTYTLQWTAGNRIFNIVNLANSGNSSVQFRAQVRKVTGVATSAPFLGSDIATGIGIGQLYSQNLNASDPDDVLGNGTLTYEALTGTSDLAPDTNVIDVPKLQANGQVEIPVGTTSGMANNSYYVYKVRVTDDQGDFAERDVLLRAVTPNRPPVINGLNTSTGYDINAGDTQTITFNATDPDSGDVVNISGAGLPSWATLTQTAGNPAQATLVLNPPAGANTRTYRLNFDAVDDDTTQVLTGSRTIEVRVAGTPETQLLTWPASSTTSTSASFTFAAASPSYTFECSIDGGTTWDPCTSPQTYTGLADGNRTFKVRANDGTNVDPTPASYSWLIDSTAPTTTFVTKPAAATTSTTANFSFTTGESGPVTYQCSLDNAAFTSCTTPRTYSGLADGQHELRVKATDGLGNVESPAASYEWTIDRTAPNTTIDSAPPALTSDPDATITFSSNEGGATFECSLDSGPYAACTSPKQYTGLADGPHSVSVRAIDAAGNVDPTPATASWTVDGTAPDTTLTSQPPALTNATDASFGFSSGDPNATFECQLDGGGWNACSSPEALTGLADGTHTFEVRAVDDAGNTDPTPASFTWEVDTAAPDTTLTTTPPAKSTSASATFAFSSPDGSATFACKLDGGSWAPCTSPHALTSLAEGSHTLQVRATDAAGNTGPAESHTWVVDTIAPPAPGLTQAPSAIASSSTFAFDREPGATLECQLDGGAWTACDPSFTPTLPDGTHTLRVRQTDDAGNVSAVAERTWTLDRVAPEAPTVLSGPAPTTTDRTATFEFTAEPGATVECRIDGGEWTICASPLVLPDLGLGDHVLELRATDGAGNVSPLRTERWTVVKPADPAKPAATPTPAPDGPKAARVEVGQNVSVDPKKSMVGCTLTGVNITACRVAIFAKKSELGLAEPGSPEDTLVRIGTGYAQTDGSTGRVGVKVVLNATGKKAAARPGGVKVRVNIKARPSTGGESLYAHRYSRIRPATQLVVPSDGLFATDSSAISRVGKRYLQSVAGSLYGAKTVKCVGHTDAQGAADYNQRLGLARARAVCHYLTRLGVKAGKRAVSVGEARPRATNRTAAGRALNRRVELSVRFE